MKDDDVLGDVVHRVKELHVARTLLAGGVASGRCFGGKSSKSPSHLGFRFIEEE